MLKLQTLAALKALDAGHVIYKTGETSFDIHLCKCPHIVIIFKNLQKRGWVHAMPSDTRTGLERYTISRSGADALALGLDWYYSFPLPKRIGAHMGLLQLA